MGSWDNAKWVDVFILSLHLRRKVEYNGLQWETGVFCLWALHTDAVEHNGLQWETGVICLWASCTDALVDADAITCECQEYICIQVPIMVFLCPSLNYWEVPTRSGHPMHLQFYLGPPHTVIYREAFQWCMGLRTLTGGMVWLGGIRSDFGPCSACHVLIPHTADMQ